MDTDLPPVTCRIKQPVLRLTANRLRPQHWNFHDVENPWVTPVLLLAFVLRHLLILAFAYRSNPASPCLSWPQPLARDAPALQLSGICKAHHLHRRFLFLRDTQGAGPEISATAHCLRFRKCCKKPHPSVPEKGCDRAGGECWFDRMAAERLSNAISSIGWLFMQSRQAGLPVPAKCASRPLAGVSPRRWPSLCAARSESQDTFRQDAARDRGSCLPGRGGVSWVDHSVLPAILAGQVRDQRLRNRKAGRATAARFASPLSAINCSSCP